MRVAVIGAGASGLMAAYAAACNGNEVTVYEKNEKCGKKIYITGKGRCNVTNDSSPQDFLPNVVRNSKFLTGAIYSFPPERTKNFFIDGGIALKTERGNRVFPLSDKSSDIIRCLEKSCKNVGVAFNFGCCVKEIKVINSTVCGIIVNNNLISCDKVLVCTGGLSYPATGSTGDGYDFAKKCGHKITELRPALCGVNLKGSFFYQLQGLTLKNVRLNVYNSNKCISSELGEVLFTHFGVSGPLVLSASSMINHIDLSNVKFVIDLKPALDEVTLDARILRDFSENSNKSISNCLKSLLPNALIPEILNRSSIAPDKKVNVISKAERSALLTNIKNFDMIVKSLQGFDEAIVTSGGVCVNEISPKTMESKIVKGLHFCGEVLDVDAVTGGFNLQIAFATGFAAGNSIR